MQRYIEGRSQPFSWFLYILPALLVYLVFLAYPLFSSMLTSFMTGNHAQIQTFVGFDNYVRLFTEEELSTRYFSAFRNTVIFFAIHMLVQNVLGMLFANLLQNKHLKGRKFYQTIIFIPATLAIIVTGYLWKLILNPQWGAFNLVLKALGSEHANFPWLGTPGVSLVVISLVSSWQWVGIPTMFFISALGNIPDELYEAAAISGASPWQVFTNIKLPLIMPTVGVVSTLTFVNNFNAFDVVFAMENVNGAPDYSTDILGTFFYRTGIAGQHPIGIPDRGMGAAVATVTFVVLIIGVALIRHITVKQDEA